MQRLIQRRVVATLLGILLDLVFVVPFRVSVHQSPELLGVGQWMGGLLSLKLGCRILMDTPSLARLAPRLRLGLQEVSQRGLQQLKLRDLLDKVCLFVSILREESIDVSLCVACSCVNASSMVH